MTQICCSASLPPMPPFSKAAYYFLLKTASDVEIPHPRKNRGSTIIRYKIVPKHHRSEDIKCNCLLSHDCPALIRILVGPILSESHHNSLLCAIQRSDMRWQPRTGMAVINSDCTIIHTKLRISAWQSGTYKKRKKKF